jgi:superfamily II DNA/RNA helicase
LESLLREVYTKKKEKEKVIIFALYKNSCEGLYQTLQRKNWPVTTIHGGPFFLSSYSSFLKKKLNSNSFANPFSSSFATDKAQSFRDQAIDSFKNGTYPILVATDVASRGLDIKDVKYVVNYEFPLTIEDYVYASCLFFLLSFFLQLK